LGAGVLETIDRDAGMLASFQIGNAIRVAFMG
jgi:hypothetical protein